MPVRTRRDSRVEASQAADRRDSISLESVSGTFEIRKSHRSGEVGSIGNPFGFTDETRVARSVTLGRRLIITVLKTSVLSTARAFTLLSVWVCCTSHAGRLSRSVYNERIDGCCKEKTEKNQQRECHP